MKTIPISHVVAALGFAALAILAAIYIPEQRLEKLADLVGRIVEDPAGALAAVSLLGGAIATLRAAWLRQPPGGPPPPAAPPSAGGDSDGPPTRPRRVTMPPSTDTRVERGYRDPAAPQAPRFLVVPGAVVRVGGSVTDGHVALGCSIAIAIALGLSTTLLAGCGASALRTHQTIATIARVSVVAAYPAIDAACEVRMHQCTDAACLDGVRRDCETAVIARGVVHEAVESYVDTIKIAAHAEEGRVGPALDTALTMLARAYETARDTIARTTGYQLPELPPEALAILRALASGVVSMTGGAS